ncbi:MAG: flagellar hook-basal body complex protein [Pseudomonadota bacterium]
MVQISVQAASVCSDRFATHALNLAAAGAVAGKTTGNFISTFNVNGQEGIESTDIRYLTQIGQALPAIDPTNFTIAGQGFAVVRDETSAAGTIGFCRDCTFHADGNKNFVNNLGQFLQVFLTDADGTPINPDVTTTTNLTTLNTGTIAQAAQATSTIDIKMLLNGKAVAADTYPMTLPITDSYGNVRNLTATWTKTDAAPASANGTQVWTLTIADSSAVPGTINETYASGMVVEFDGEGFPSGYGNPSSANPPTLDVTWHDGPVPSVIALGLGTIGKNDGVIVSGAEFSVNSLIPDGYAAGNFSSMEFTKEGFGIAHYTNGRQANYCQIPVALFNNANALKEAVPGVFKQTAGSGVYNLFNPGQGGAGVLVPQTTEGSTVNGTQVYLDMLDTQRVYVGNLKAIEVDKEMNNRLMNI